MEIDFDDFKVHDNLLNLNVEKFKASIARLLPSRRPPNRSKLIKTRHEDNDDTDDPSHRCYNPNSVDSKSLVETTSTTDFVSENPPTDSATLPSPQQTVVANAAAISSGHQSPFAVTSPSQTNETLSQRKSISDETLTPIDDNDANSDSNKRNSKTRWPFHFTRLKFRTPNKANDEFPEAKSELESALQRVLRSKGESFPSKLVQQNHSVKKEDTKIPPKIIEPIVYPKRVTFVTAASLKETKQRLRHLDDFKKVGSQCAINSVESSSGVEPDMSSCVDSLAESDKDDECSSAAGVNNNLTSDCSFNNSGISSAATDTNTYESDEWDDHRQPHDFEPDSDSSTKNTILSYSKPAFETHLFNDSEIAAELELPSTSMVRELTATVVSHQDESSNQKMDTPLLMPKGADIFELLRRFEKRVADEAATVVKPATENSSKLRTSGTDTWQRPKTPKDDNSVTHAKVINDSWMMRTARTSPDSLRLDTSTSSTGSIAIATSWRTTPFKTRAWDSVGTPPVTRGRVLEALESLRQSSNGHDFEPNSQLFRRSNDSQGMDGLAPKPHSIAHDDAINVESQFANTYVISQFGEKLSSPQTTGQLRTNIVNVHGAETLSLVAEVAAPTSEIKTQKKVEFSKTEVHIAAVEPGKIKTIETDEKPHPIGLYMHKRRSLSASPKMMGVRSGCIKFDDYEQHKKVGVSQELKSRPNRRSSFNAPNSNRYPSFTWNEDNSRSRRASLSILDENQSDTTVDGYSTKINFENESITEIANSESRKQNTENVLSPQSEDEKILEKSDFNPLKIEEAEATTDSDCTSVGIKHAQITSAAVDVFQYVRPEDTITSAKKFDTILQNLHDSKKAEYTPAPVITGAHDSNYLSHQPDICRSKHRSGEEHIKSHRLADDRHHSRIYTEPKENRQAHRTTDTSIMKSSSCRPKTDYRPVRIIHQGVRLQGKWFADGRRLTHFPASSTPKSELGGSKAGSRTSMPSSKAPKEPDHMNGIGGGSLRKKMSTTTASSAGRERLLDSGRHSWLNLPRECKFVTSSSAADRQEAIKSMQITQPSPTGDSVDSDVISKHTAHSHHCSSRLPTPYSSRKSRKVEAVNVAGSARTKATNLGRDARNGIASVTHTDVSNKEDMSSHRTTHRKSSKPLTTEKPELRLIDRQDSNRGTPYAKIRSTTGADIAPSEKFLLARNTSNSSRGSRSNSYEFKYPVLKTEERSKQRAARMLQRAASREILMRRGHISSSEDIPSASDIRGSRAAANKLKPSRKVISTKVSKLEATSQQSSRIRASPRSKPTRNTKESSISARVTRPMR